MYLLIEGAETPPYSSLGSNAGSRKIMRLDTTILSSSHIYISSPLIESSCPKGNLSARRRLGLLVYFLESDELLGLLSHRSHVILNFALRHTEELVDAGYQKPLHTAEHVLLLSEISHYYMSPGKGAGVSAKQNHPATESRATWVEVV